MQSDYYLWLLNEVSDGNHYKLLKFLYDTPFEWQFTLDENRAAGGLNLRNRYSNEYGINLSDLKTGPCSILEMLIALSERMVELLSYDVFRWFWILIRNLRLDEYDDFHFDERRINYILAVWLNREYDYMGRGSLFPLEHYDGDCRTLDIWGQMNAWIEEKFPHTDEWLH